MISLHAPFTDCKPLNEIQRSPQLQSVVCDANLERALAAAARGYAILPCDNRKRPYTQRGVYDASTDPATIRHWWQRWPQAQVGIACGESGIVVVDVDLYKTNQPLAALLPEVLHAAYAQATPRGGIHLFFRQPPDTRIGCERGKLPSCVDLKGIGGYVVLYDDALTRVSPATLPLPPQSLLDKLTEAHQNATEAPGAILAATKPKYTPYAPSAHCEALQREQQNARRGTRSSHDFNLACFMLREGADPAEVAAAIAKGPKACAKRRHAERYIAATVAAARAAVDNPTGNPYGPSITRALLPEGLRAAEQVIANPLVCANVLRARGISRPANYLPDVATLIALCRKACATTIRTSNRDLQLACGYGSSRTVFNHLRALEAAGLIQAERTATGTQIHAAALVKALAEAENSTDCGKWFPFAELKLTHDIFTTSPYRVAMERRQQPTVLLPSFGPAGRLLMAALERGGTVAALVAATSLSERTVRGLVARMREAGIIFTTTTGRADYLELHPNWMARLDEAMINFTTYGVGNLRAGRAHCQIIAWGKQRLISNEDLSPAHRDWLRRKIEQHWRAAALCYQRAIHDWALPWINPTHREIYDFFKYLDAPGSSI